MRSGRSHLVPKEYSLRKTQKPQKPKQVKERSLDLKEEGKDTSDAALLNQLKEKNKEFIEMLKKQYPSPEDRRLLGI